MTILKLWGRAALTLFGVACFVAAAFVATWDEGPEPPPAEHDHPVMLVPECQSDTSGSVTITLCR